MFKSSGYEYFTCIQLLNLAIQFKELAPSGLIKIKDFVDSFICYTTFSAGLNLVPEVFSGYDSQALQQVPFNLPINFRCVMCLIHLKQNL